MRYGVFTPLCGREGHLRRLQQAQPRFGVKTFRHNRQFGNRSLCSENFKASRSGEDRLRVAGVIPKPRVAGQFLERFQEPGDVIRGIFLPERLLQILLQISKADRILPVVRVMPVGRLEEREAGRLRTGERAAEIGRDWSHHGQWDWVKAVDITESTRIDLAALFFSGRPSAAIGW